MHGAALETHWQEGYVYARILGNYFMSGFHRAHHKTEKNHWYYRYKRQNHRCKYAGRYSDSEQHSFLLQPFRLQCQYRHRLRADCKQQPFGPPEAGSRCSRAGRAFSAEALPVSAAGYSDLHEHLSRFLQAQRARGIHSQHPQPGDPEGYKARSEWRRPAVQLDLSGKRPRLFQY